MTEDSAIARFIAENPTAVFAAETYAFNISRLGERVTLGRLRAEHRSATKDYTR